MRSEVEASFCEFLFESPPMCGQCDSIICNGYTIPFGPIEDTDPVEQF